MAKGRGGKRTAHDSTNELDSLLAQTTRLDRNQFHSLDPIMPSDIPEDYIAIEDRDRRIKAPSSPSMALKRGLENVRGKFIFHNPLPQYKYLICSRRKERKEVLHARFNKKGGLGSASRMFKAPIRTAYSKIICRR